MNLKEKYKKETIKKLKEEFNYKNDLEMPRLEKVVINVGFGRNSKDKAYVDNVVHALTEITGQKPIMTKARKAISSFKIREGMVIGACVTLRDKRMYDFVEKLIHVTFPRVRDFRGLDYKSVDKTGNMTIGFKEHVSFPEISVDEVENVFGLEVCLHTTAKVREEGIKLFKLLGFPFKRTN